MNDEEDTPIHGVLMYNERCEVCDNLIYYRLYENEGECKECGNKQLRYTNTQGPKQNDR